MAQRCGGRQGSEKFFVQMWTANENPQVNLISRLKAVLTLLRAGERVESEASSSHAQGAPLNPRIAIESFQIPCESDGVEQGGV